MFRKGYCSSRRAAHLYIGLSRNLRPLDEIYKGPTTVYRLFKTPEHADQMADGTVYFSTLRRCRAYEGANGDQDDATLRRNYGPFDANLKKRLDKRIHQAGYQMPWGEVEGKIDTVQFIERLEDTFVLCCTCRSDYAALAERFGPHCVKIHNVPAFSEIAGGLLNLHCKEATNLLIGKVKYKRRFLVGEQKVNGHIGFLKSPNFAVEEEFRVMLTVPNEVSIEPLTVSSAYLRTYVERVA